MSYQFTDQPITYDAHGVARFVENPIVRYMLDVGGIDMNHLAARDFDAGASAQFAQLIGYSVAGYGSLSYVSDALYERATTDNAADTQPGYAAGFDTGFAAGMARAIQVLEEYRESEAQR